MRKALVLLTLFPALALAKAKVVATTSDLGALAREVGGDDIELLVLAKATQDPHYVDGKPSLVLAVSRADLLLLNGLDLEVGWLPVVIQTSRNPKVQKGAEGYLDCSTAVTPKEVPLQKLDRSMGDIHPGGNPHYTKDPRNAVPLARAIAQRLMAQDSAAGPRIEQRLKAFEALASSRIAEWQRALEPYKGTPVVAYHKSWFYFTEWAGVDEVAFIEPKPGIAPSPAHVTNVLKVIRQRKVPLIIQEEWYAPSTSELLAKASGAKLVRVPGSAPEGQRYLDYVGGMVAAMQQALPATR